MQTEKTYIQITCNQTCWNNIGHQFFNYRAPFEDCKATI